MFDNDTNLKHKNVSTLISVKCVMTRWKYHHNTVKITEIRRIILDLHIRKNIFGILWFCCPSLHLADNNGRVLWCWCVTSLTQREEVWQTFTDQENSAGMSGMIFDIWFLQRASQVVSPPPASTREDAWVTAVLLSIWEAKEANRKVSGGPPLREWRLNERRGVVICSSIIQQRKYTASACER